MTLAFFIGTENIQFTARLRVLLSNLTLQPFNGKLTAVLPKIIIVSGYKKRIVCPVLYRHNLKVNKMRRFSFEDQWVKSDIVTS